MTERFAILIVDDNANNRLTLRALLGRLADCDLVEADSGEAALLTAVQQPINLILLDVQMPGMDGFETARHLQMTERTRRIPIVFLTAVFKADEFVARGMGAGAVDYLTKPIDDNLLLSRVRLYRHLYEREAILEATVKQLLEKERALSEAKERAEAMVRELAANAGKLRMLNEAMEQSPNSLFITDTRGVIEYVNPRFIEHTGYTAAEAIGRKPSLFKSGQTPLATYQELWGTILAGKIWRGELLNRKKDGSLYWVSASIAPVRDEQGVVANFVGTHNDITERVSVLEELRRAKESAERANRAKSVFLANMSHELRTPLNAILGFARLLERNPGINDEGRQQLATINRSGQHLLALINDVLEISRIEAGRVETRTAVFGLHELLRDVEDMMRGRAWDKGLAFAVEREAGLPPHVIGDAHHLKQVLINLLGNAVKYTDHGHVRLSAKVGADAPCVPGIPLYVPEGRYPLGGGQVTAAGSAAGGRIRFEVADSGHGISAEDQAKLFEAFYQTEVGITKAEGTGLGLAISHEYARLMGGELSVASQPGQGSVFSLELPLIAAEAPVTAASVRQGRVIGLEAGTAPPRILVVDDKADNRNLVSQILKPAGFEVRTADNGQQAIEVFESWRPQLIWMDMRMPVMDGYAATRRIRALPGGPEVKIMALTASVFEEDHPAILAAGCNGVVRKPVDEERLFQVMGELLGLPYRYATEGASTPTRSATPLDLSCLPRELRAELAHAALTLDVDATKAIVARIGRDRGAEVAAELAMLVAQFRFDQIVALCTEESGDFHE